MRSFELIDFYALVSNPFTMTYLFRPNSLRIQ